ncbi:LytR/AlgR family response regulator transcription factor [[Clostridium] dakarense]|uniref:LytR/AlgR family response regulator transcription factor n=1 Tax=Faecalimicrobium dakarense TaxID=1301100 RepID=UPI0004B89BAB|nr:LytTR family DNA-binding domain-containing protein [[Clostridium] dakarense]
MVLNIAICDDELIHRQVLSNYLDRTFPIKSYKLVEFANGEELIENYPEKLDILLLDIQMTGINGIEAAKKIRMFDTNVVIIFTTAIIEFMQQGYEVRAFRYLLKPIDYNEFSKHLLECKEDIANSYKNYLTIKEETEGNIIIIPIDSILYIETDSRCVLIHTDSQTYRTKVKINKFEKDLEDKKFYRCHRSYLINLNKVRCISKDSILIKNNEILVSRYKIKDLKTRVTDILGDLL